MTGGEHAGQRGRSPADLTVALLSPGWPVDAFGNGIVTYTASLRRALQARGTRVFVLARRVIGDAAEADVIRLGGFDRPRGLLRRALNWVAHRADLDYILARRVASSILREAWRLRTTVGLDVIEMEESFGWARFIAPRSPVPVVVRLHGPWFLVGTALDVPREGLERRVRCEAAGIRAAHGVTASSRAVLDAVRASLGIALRDAKVVPLPIAPVPDPDRWRLEGCDRDRILFVGRFDRVKGGDVVVTAFVRLLAQCPRARLTIVGPDQGVVEDGRCEPLSHFVERGLPGSLRDGRIEYLGFQPPARLGELRRRAVVTVVPSRFETLGYTAVEAMALGCPVIVSNVGGLAELVQHERNGLLVPPGEAEALAATLKRLLESPDLAVRLGERARADCVERYHPAVIAEQTLAFYRGVIESRRRDA